jgi:hypothetical protein
MPGPTFESHSVIGLAGVDLFEGRRIFWDLAAMRVASAPSGGAIGDCWAPIESDWMRPWRVLAPVTVNGVQGMAMIDTGAERTIINSAFAEAIGPRETQLNGEIAGIDGRPIPLLRTTVDTAQIGVWSWDGQEIHIADLALFDRMGPSDQRYMLLGMDWLRGRRFVLDYGTEQVWIEP